MLSFSLYILHTRNKFFSKSIIVLFPDIIKLISMPHTRKVKTEFMPKLQFDHENSFLYLAYIDEEEEELTVPLETFVILFCLQYCEIGNVRVRLLQGQDSGGTVVRVGRQDQQLVRQEETPAELLAVRLPAWYLPAQRSCIAGLCAVVRYACRLGTATGAGPHCRDLLGFQAGCLSAPREVSTWTQVTTALSNMHSTVV